MLQKAVHYRTCIRTIRLVLILLIAALFIWFNHIFLRTTVQNKLVTFINPIPYLVHFELDQQHPTTFFTLPAFPSYVEWCHVNHKLCSIVPLQKLYADMQWIGSIQYVGSVGGGSEMASVGNLIDNVTTLDPYRYYPYAFAQLIVPLQKREGTTGEMQVQKESWMIAKRLAEKGAYYNCDQKKLDYIGGLSGDMFMDEVYTTGQRLLYGNACPTYELPHYAGFNAFYYRGDTEDAAAWYKVSAFHDDAPGIAPLMAAMVYGRGGQHLKSAALRYDRYINLGAEDALQNDILRADASKAMKKSVFELQLQMIAEAEARSKDCGKSYTCLRDKGFIRESVQHSYNDLCEQGKNTGNVRCGILAIGLQERWITLEGGLAYPEGPDYHYNWSTEYNSRWVAPGK